MNTTVHRQEIEFMKVVIREVVVIFKHATGNGNATFCINVCDSQMTNRPELWSSPGFPFSPIVTLTFEILSYTSQ